ncbi:MAG: hypothetical protein EXR99_03990 [Gemmataceae bacterium]|nr:hypothetical protein [Gemmataceae bacterium]
MEEVKKTVLVLCDDLMFGSRIGGEVRALGGVCRQVKTGEKFLELAATAGVVGAAIDLDTAGESLVGIMEKWREVAGAGVSVLGFGSHVDVESLQRAREAGCTPVLPRSRFAATLPQLALSWLNNSC